MADTKITGLTASGAIADGDLLPIVDVSDTTQSAEGSTRKITKANLTTDLAPKASPVLTGPTQVDTLELGHATDTTIARSGAGAITVEGTQVILSGAALGTPASGTLTNCAGLPVAGITASTSAALGVGSIELGHATDTTIARSGAGDITLEGNAVYRAGGTDVSFADGGTGISSWTQYLVPYAATTTSIGQIAIGTSGQVLTSNGAGAAPTFQAAAGGATPQMIKSVSVYDSAQFLEAQTNGTTTYNYEGVVISSSATGSSYKSIRVISQGLANFGLDSHFVAMVDAQSTPSDTVQCYIGVGAVTVSGAGHTFTTDHYGFKIIKVGAGWVISATNGDGTTETATDTGITNAGSAHRYHAVYDVGTNIKFYVDDVLKATHTTNLPDTSDTTLMQFSVSNAGLAENAEFKLYQFNYNKNAQ